MSNNKADGNNRSIRCNALYKTPDSFNCNLKPAQAIRLAYYLLEKAHQIIDQNLGETAVQLYNAGANSETLAVGHIKARKGPRRSKGKQVTGKALEQS